VVPNVQILIVEARCHGAVVDALTDATALVALRDRLEYLR
jgi:hypothetical protein